MTDWVLLEQGWATEKPRSICLPDGKKYALNSDIKDVQNQFVKYYESIKKNAVNLAEELGVYPSTSRQAGVRDKHLAYTQ